MNAVPELIVMLTYNDRTAPDAPSVFESCKDSKASFFGFKEEGIPFSEMKRLFSRINACGKKAVLEAVTYTENDGLDAAKTAFECGCSILMGTKYYDSIHNYCREHRLKYMPFVGSVSGRPSVLCGDIEEIIAEAGEYIKKGVDGFDLLGYRFNGNPSELNRIFVKNISIPVCIAGSINSYERLDEIKAAKPWAFTIGGAFFAGSFGGTFREQIDKVCDYMV